MLGWWEVTIDQERSSAIVTPRRLAELHLNLVRLLEVTPCSTCLKVSNIHSTGPNELEADVTLQHPFPGLIKYTGFDVRGIFITDADFTFPLSGRKVAIGEDIPKLLNADGFTSLFNPAEFPESQPGPPALRYIPGKWATGDDLTATLNPFVAYKRDAPRRMFEAGGVETRTIRIYALPGQLHFGYAVDACWKLTQNVVDPEDDFPDDANCLEAYEVVISDLQELNSWPESSIPISLAVFDHQGPDTISAVLVEVPGIIDGQLQLEFSETKYDGSSIYEGWITNELEAGWGDYPLLVRVIDTEVDQNLGAVDAWNFTTVGVRDGWARTWGSKGYGYYEKGWSVAVDNSGYVYVTGAFSGDVDFDPGPGEDIQEAYGGLDAFLSKFDLNGNFIWARIWGAENPDCGHDITIDDAGNIYVVGSFSHKVDFDPGPGEYNFWSSDDSTDVSLSKFEPNGNFLWAKTWGNADTYSGYNYSTVSVDALGNAYVAGSFKGTVDFDPGPEEDNHSSDLGYSTFLSKFDSEGTFNWARSWGTTTPYGHAHGWGVAADLEGNAYVSGLFSGTVDFDPGPGEDLQTSDGTFISKFDPEGNYQWARTWPADSGAGNYPSVVADDSGGIYVTGNFMDSTDFDPGPGDTIHDPEYIDGFVSRFDSDGIFQWVQTWGATGGGTGPVRNHNIAVDNLGSVFTAGYFSQTVDFDPGPGEDNHTAQSLDCFVTKFNTEGVFHWARTWGGPENIGPSDAAYGVIADSSGDVYVTGCFMGTVDFDPGPGVDTHTAKYGTDIFLSKFPPDGNW